MPPRRRLTLIDLMTAVGAAAVGLALVGWAAPGRFGPALIVIGPVLGIVWHRWRGGRGILGGALGGAAHAGIGLLVFATGPHWPGAASPSTMADWPFQLVVMTATCVAYGAALGVVAWLTAAAAGRPRAPVPPSPNGWSPWTGDRPLHPRLRPPDAAHHPLT